jgi:hypothetical protein
MDKKFLLLGFTIIFTSACSMVAEIELATRTVVGAYCMAPSAIREINRERINTAIAPHTIKITCFQEI